MEQVIYDQFRPLTLSLIDESQKHHGHGGVKHGSTETHFHLKINCPILLQHGRVQAHRAIYEALAPEFNQGLHALRITFMS